MPKIRNWSKKQTGGFAGAEAWKNDPTGRTVSISQSYGDWIVNINGNKKKFDNKEDAREYAIQWMKDNPKAGRKGSRFRRSRANLGR